MDKREQRQKKTIIKVPVTTEQLQMIHERMREAHTDNRSAFIRKMVLDGYILELDDTHFRKMNCLLRNISNNFNQVAKRMNSTGHVYEADLLEMAQMLNRIWDTQNQLLSRLAQLK